MLECFFYSTSRSLNIEASIGDKFITVIIADISFSSIHAFFINNSVVQESAAIIIKIPLIIFHFT